MAVRWCLTLGFLAMHLFPRFRIGSPCPPTNSLCRVPQHGDLFWSLSSPRSENMPSLWGPLLFQTPGSETLYLMEVGETVTIQNISTLSMNFQNVMRKNFSFIFLFISFFPLVSYSWQLLARYYWKFAFNTLLTRTWIYQLNLFLNFYFLMNTKNFFKWIRPLL